MNKTKQHVYVVFNYTQRRIVEIFSSEWGAVKRKQREVEKSQAGKPDKFSSGYRKKKDYIAVLEMSVQGTEMWSNNVVQLK